MSNSFKAIAGIDEVGRGALAGDLVVACVVVRHGAALIEGVRDSKVLSRSQREQLFSKIIQEHEYSSASIPAEQIDEIGISKAFQLACQRSAEKISSFAQTLFLIDGNMKFTQKNFISVIKGDMLIYSIAAASIIAKVLRDRAMQNLAKTFPNYDWQNNVGYGTKAHCTAIKNFGLSKHHRRSFCKNLLTT